MIIRMSQPWRHPKTGVWYYRARVPSDLFDQLKGVRTTFEFDDVVRTVTLAEFCKVSLGTTDRRQALSRHAAVSDQAQARWEACRKGEQRLNKQQRVGLAGEWYREFIALHAGEPGSALDWEDYGDLLRDGLNYLDEESDGVQSEPYAPQEAARRLSRLIDLDGWLETRGLVLDRFTRRELLFEVARALVEATKTLMRMARGDYSQDKTAERFRCRYFTNRLSLQLSKRRRRRMSR